MSMRDYEELKDIVIPESQEKIMDIICNAWEECRGSDCMNCPDRNMICLDRASIMECTALKYSRMLVEAGYVQVVPGYWTRELIRNENGGCVGAKMICSNCKQDNKHDEYMLYCPNCGAKMDMGRI